MTSALRSIGKAWILLSIEDIFSSRLGAFSSDLFREPEGSRTSLAFVVPDFLSTKSAGKYKPSVFLGCNASVTSSIHQYLFSRPFVKRLVNSIWASTSKFDKAFLN